MDAKNFGAVLREMGKRGESAYACVDGEECIDIPAQALKGRAGTLGKTFSGFLNFKTGKLRFDCAEDPSFYLEMDLQNVPALTASPDGRDGQDAIHRSYANATALSNQL